MRVYAGTSGFSYKEWRRSFYPEGLPASGMLAYYATRLPAVEINNTFYRMPTPEMLAGWAEQVPSEFRFVLKAARRITHQQKLVNVGDSVAYLFTIAAILGGRLGPVLFQLPPFLRKDTARLRDFLAVLPEGCRAALEFRNPSWFADDVYEALRERDAALCGGDVDDTEKRPPLVATASWGYLRLRRSAYAPGELESWAASIIGQPWSEAYAFFKHEEQGPGLAQRLNQLTGGATLKAPEGPTISAAKPRALEQLDVVGPRARAVSKRRKRG